MTLNDDELERIEQLDGELTKLRTRYRNTVKHLENSASVTPHCATSLYEIQGMARSIERLEGQMNELLDGKDEGSEWNSVKDI